MKYYVAYGSNLSLDIMKKRSGSCKVVGTSELKDMRLVFKGSADDYAYLTLEKALGYTVPIAIYQISKFAEKKLDFYEGYPQLYRKEMIPFMIQGEEMEGLIYLMRDIYPKRKPSTEYLYSCLLGYRDFNFPTSYLDEALEYSCPKVYQK